MAASKRDLLALDLDSIIESAGDDLDALAGQRIFITGGTGFFGSWLLESLAWANKKLDLHVSAVVLTRDSNAFRNKCPHLTECPEITFLTGNVLDFDFPTGTFKYVIHAATDASATLNSERPETMVSTIVSGTRRALDFARQAKCEHFLLTSSGAVYGSQPPEVTHVRESYNGAPDPLIPANAYAEGKRLAELLCAIACKDGRMQAKIARAFAFVGPYLPLDIHFAVGNFIRDGLHGGPIKIGGDGTPRRSYLYASDLAIWLWAILVRGGSCRAYNVGSEESLSIKQVAEAVSRNFEPAPVIEIAGQPDASRQISQYVPSTERARSELGLQVGVSLEQALERTVAWHRANV